MQIEAQKFLPIAEQARVIAFVDIEATNLKADFGTVVVVSIKPYKQEPVTFYAKPGSDKSLLKKVHAELSKYPLWVTFYGKRFDIPFLNSRLLVRGLPSLPKNHHIDLYQVVRDKTALSRRNQAHLLNWLGTDESKMSVSPNVWAEMSVNTKDKLSTLIERCESDVEGLEAMYERCKHLIGEITR